MKLQISFDMPNLGTALEVAKQVAQHADILEVGTLLLYKHGVTAIEHFKHTFEDKVIFADAKIIDRGKQAVHLLATAGADHISVMAGTNTHVIHAAVAAANETNTYIVLDLLDAPSQGLAALEAKNRGAKSLLFHQPYDTHESLTFLDNWEMIRGNTDLPICISAAITRDNIAHICRIKPDTLVIGKAITSAENPQQEAAFFRKICSD